MDRPVARFGAGRSIRGLGFALAASGSAGLVALTSIMGSALAYGSPDDPTTVLVMDGSGYPIPPAGYVSAVNDLFIQPNFPASTPQGIFTPEGFYPVTGVTTLPLATSVAEGETILNNTLEPYLTADTPVGVLAYSQSAVIASLEMEQLDPSGTPSTDPLSFVLLGDMMNPNGGLFERFEGLNLAALGIPFYGATPADDFPTDIYTAEYDGAADFPRYPLNFLSDLNAFFGFLYLHIHNHYADFTSAQVDSAILLPGSADLGAADSLTDYYMIATTDLPLLDPVRDLPVVGNPIADLLQPDLTYLVNLGYGDPLYGWSTSAADEATPFGLFPSFSDVEKLPGLLMSGAERGLQDFIGDFTGTGPNPITTSLTSLLDPSAGTSNTMSTLAELSTKFTDLISDPASWLTDVENAVNSLSSAASAAYGILLPTADIINAALTSIPSYDATLFADNISDPLNAIGLPIAADTALFTLLGGLEGVTLLNAAQTIASDLAGLIP